jgi:hypothetical protein
MVVFGALPVAGVARCHYCVPRRCRAGAAPTPLRGPPCRPAHGQASDDIRLSVRLFKRCLNDQRKFCADVEPGHMRVQVRGGGGAAAEGL